ncbi:MAG: hypothetical protein AAFX78_05015 [Cyanobacteria bacterium J06638_20]
MDRQVLTTEIPDGVPFPKFEMFEKVRYGKQLCIINGIKWICPLDGIQQEMGGYGWFYSLSFLMGKPPEDYFKAPKTQDYWEVDEAELCPLRDEEVPHANS